MKKKYSFYVFDAILFVLSVIAIYFSYLQRDPNNLLGMRINIGCVCMMATIILIGMHSDRGRKGISGLFRTVRDYEKAIATLKEVAANPENIVEDAIKDIELFSVPDLKNAFDDFKVANDSLPVPAGSFKFCDIADYFNYDLIAKIGNYAFNENVGGMLTGLGILGTFLGLIVGLQGFNFGDLEAITSSLQLLMNGLKVAFLTSIFGLSFSLIFNVFYRFFQKKAQENTTTFVETYYSFVNQKPQNEAVTQLVQRQIEQTDSMKQFAEDIAVSFTQNISDLLVPTLEGIRESIKVMTENVSKSQDQNMTRLANEFVAQMDSAMGNQLTKLGESIKVLCEWQENATTAMTETTEKILQSGDKLTSINESLQKSMEGFETYVTTLAESQTAFVKQYSELNGKLNKLMEDVNLQSEGMVELLTAEKESINNVREIDTLTKQKLDGIRDMFKKFKDQIEALVGEHNAFYKNLQNSFTAYVSQQNKIIENSAENMSTIMKNEVSQITSALQNHGRLLEEDMRKIRELQKVLTDSLREATKSMNHSAEAMQDASEDLTKNLDTAMSRTFKQFDNELATIERHLSGTISNIHDTTEELNTIVEKLPRAASAMATESGKQTAEYLKSISDAQAQINRALNSISNRVDNISRNR